MRDIKVTYNIGQDFNNYSGMKEILRDLKTWGATNISAHPNNFRFEILEIQPEALRIYCELKGLDYWTLLFGVMQLCVASEVTELENTGQSFSNIENVHCIIEASKEIENYQVPDAIHSNMIEDEEGNPLSNNNTFSSQFNVSEINESTVRFSVVVNNKYPTKYQILSLKQFSIDNKNLNLVFT